jgi:hypothetical protein
VNPSPGFRLDDRMGKNEIFIFLTLLTCSYNRTIHSPDGFRREGTVSTASRNCGNHGQRLQERGTNAPFISGSFGQDPRALRSERLQWLNNLSGKHQTPCDLGLCKNEPEYKIAAFLTKSATARFSPAPKSAGGVSGSLALSQPPHFPKHPRTYGLEAVAGTSPPFSFTPNSRAPP